MGLSVSKKKHKKLSRAVKTYKSIKLSARGKKFEFINVFVVFLKNILVNKRVNSGGGRNI